MDDDLLESIAANAPSLHTNDTVRVGPGIWWKVVGEDKSAHREMVESDLLPSAGGGSATSGDRWSTNQFWYGTGLASWGLLAGTLVVVALMCRPSAGRRHRQLVDLLKSGSTTSMTVARRRWFVVNFVGIQLLAAATILALPVTTERAVDVDGAGQQQRKYVAVWSSIE